MPKSGTSTPPTCLVHGDVHHIHLDLLCHNSQPQLSIKKKHSKVTCRVGTKPGSSVTTMQAVKTNCETPTHLYDTRPTNGTKREQTSTKPLRDNRTVIDYSVLNGGYDTEVGDSPKWRQRHLSRPSHEPTVP